MKNNPAWQKFFQDKWGAAALLVVIIYIFTAVGVEIYSFHCRSNRKIPFYNISSELRYAPPSRTHIFGTDYQGRDVFARCTAGCASALKTGFISGIIAVVIGVSLGMISGYWVEKLMKQRFGFSVLLPPCRLCFSFWHLHC